MSFYDSWNFEGLEFFSKIKISPTICNPCPEFLNVVKKLKSDTPPPEV